MTAIGLGLAACLYWALILCAISPPRTTFAAPIPVPTVAACSSPEYRQFDFWVGDWDAFEIGTQTKDAHVRVDRILDGCVVHEQYDGANGHKGQSFSIYDASRKVWHQSWVTNRGELLMIEGKFQNGQMVLSGADRTASAAEREVRGTWKAVDGGVRETGVTSSDGGKTWQPWFDLVFRPAVTAKETPTRSDSDVHGQTPSFRSQGN